MTCDRGLDCLGLLKETPAILRGLMRELRMWVVVFGLFAAKALKEMVGTWGLEPQTSTVSR